MQEFPIGEVARRAGIRPSALRYYESIGLMPTPQRVNGRRRYDEHTVEMLKIVQLAQSAGFTVAEIQTLLHGFAPDTPPAARWQAFAKQKIRKLDAQIARAQQMKRVVETGLQCGCLRLEDCVIVLEEARCGTSTVDVPIVLDHRECCEGTERLTHSDVEIQADGMRRQLRMQTR